MSQVKKIRDRRKVKLQNGGQPSQGFTTQEFIDKFGFDPTLETQEEIEDFQIEQSNLTDEQTKSSSKKSCTKKTRLCSKKRRYSI